MHEFMSWMVLYTFIFMYGGYIDFLLGSIKIMTSLFSIYSKVFPNILAKPEFFAFDWL